MARLGNDLWHFLYFSRLLVTVPGGPGWRVYRGLLCGTESGRVAPPTTEVKLRGARGIKIGARKADSGVCRWREGVLRR